MKKFTITLALSIMAVLLITIPCNAKGKGAIPEREAVSTKVHGCGGPHRSSVEALETWWSEGCGLFGLQALTTAKAGGSGWK